MKMNNRIIGLTLAAAALTGSITSCDSYFDDVPNNAVSIDDIFENRGMTLGWLTNIYSITPDWTNRYAGGTAMYWNGATIEGYLPWDWVETHDIITGTMSSSTKYVNRIWSNLYKGIQNCNIYLARVDGCDPLLPEEKAATKAEVRALRAYFYLQLVKQYGPVPLFGDKEANFDDDLNDSQLPRNTVDECFDYIISEFKAALESGDLLSSFDDQGAYESQHMGNFTSEAVRGFLADAYLFRASYVFNGDPYYKDLANPDGTKLFPQERDESKWRDAKQAALDIINSGKYSLVLRDMYDHQVTNLSEACPYKSTFFASMATSTNEELIYGRPNSANDCYVLVPRFENCPSSAPRGSGGLSVPLEFVDLFFTNKGLRIDEDPDYFKYDVDNPPTAVRGQAAITNTRAYVDPLSGYQYFTMSGQGQGVSTAVPTSILKQFYNREARFYLNITFHNRQWEFQGNLPVQMHFSGNSGANGSSHDFPIFGVIARKNYYEKQSNWTMSMVLRLAEIYLDYAEACAELGETEEALKYLNKIRNRAGVAEYGLNAGDDGRDARNLKKIVLPGYTKDDLLKAIYRERILELSYENKHYFDVRRWGVAEGKWRTDGPEMTDGWIYPAYHKGGEGGSFTGFNVHNVGATAENQAVNFYKRITQQTRIYTKRMTFFPIPEDEIVRDKQLVQNTGW